MILQLKLLVAVLDQSLFFTVASSQFRLYFSQFGMKFIVFVCIIGTMNDWQPQNWFDGISCFVT